MALSIFLVGGMVLILIIAVWGLIHIMRPSVVEAPPGDIAPPSVLYSSRFQKFTKAVFLSLGLSSHLAKTTLHTFPPSMYSPRYLFGLKWELFNVNKLLTACLLILIGVLFSRHFIPKWVGLTWVDPAAGICVSEASKLAVFEDQLYAELRLPESTALVASLYTALTGLQTLMASSTVFPGTAYPEACQDAAEYVINQGLTKTCATSITADLGTYGSVYNALNLNGFSGHVSGTVDIACPDIAGAESDYSALGRFQVIQAQKARQPVVVSGEPTPTAIQDIASFIAELLFQVDVASSVYIGYAAVCLFFNTPIRLFHTPVMVRVRRSLFRVPKLPFIAIVILLWWGYTYVFVVIESPALSLFLHNVQTDPCYAQPAFYAERNAFITESCRTLINLNNNYTNNLDALTSIYQGLSFCSAECTADPSATYCSPFAASMLYNYATANSTLYNSTAFPGANRCSDINELRSRYMKAPSSHANSLFWISSGIVGQIFIKFMLCNFMLSALYVADPLCVHGGTFEADNTLLYDADDDKLRRLCAEVNTMLRLRSVGGLVLWALLTAFTLGDIVYAVSVSSSSSWDWNASAIIVVAIAGVMLLSVLLYPVRSRVWACTKACCRCTGRACGRCCVWAFCCRKASPPTA